MAKYPIHPPRKQRTRTHVLADLSVNYVERFVLRCGFAVDEIRSDYGVDLAVFTFDQDGFLESGVIWLQLKATDNLKTTRDRKDFTVRIDRRDILAWIAERYPVILIVYDNQNEEAYWLSIHKYFSNPVVFSKSLGETMTIRVPKKQRLNVQAIRAFAAEKAALFSPRED